MVVKIIAVFALIALPMNISMWHRSHTSPTTYRWDLTVYKSATVYLRDGLLGIHVLSMSTKTAIDSEFETPLTYDPLASKPLGFMSMFLHSNAQGGMRNTWIIFPFWLPTLILSFFGILPIVRGPMRRMLRRTRGRCLECGYDLRGTRSKRCSECGTVFA